MFFIVLTMDRYSHHHQYNNQEKLCLKYECDIVRLIFGKVNSLSVKITISMKLTLIQKKIMIPIYSNFVQQVILKLFVKYGFDYKNLIHHSTLRNKLNCLHAAAQETSFGCVEYICQIANLDKFDANYDINTEGLIDIYYKDEVSMSLLCKAYICGDSNQYNAELQSLIIQVNED